MKWKIHPAASLVLISCFLLSCGKEKALTDLVDFEELPLNASGVWNGSDGSGGFTSGNIAFKNSYNSNFQSWNGFSYTNHTDTVTGDYTNQYSSIAGKGAEGSSRYGVFYFSGEPDTIKFTIPAKVAGLALCNTTYAFKAMKYGTPFSKKFGGESGNDPDWFRLTLKPINEHGLETGYAEIYLADFRFTDKARDYIANIWTSIDLSEFGFISGIIIEMSSSDSGQWGMNTPAYFCIDNIKSVLEKVNE